MAEIIVVAAIMLAAVAVFSVLYMLLVVPADYIISHSMYLSKLTDWEGGKHHEHVQ